MIDVLLTQNGRLTFSYFLVPPATFLPSLRSAKRAMASAPPSDTLSNTGAGVRVGVRVRAGVKARAGVQEDLLMPSVRIYTWTVLLLCLCVFGGRGHVLYVCTGVLNGTNSLKIHPHTEHFRKNKNTRKKRKENQTANEATSNTNQALWWGGTARHQPSCSSWLLRKRVSIATSTLFTMAHPTLLLMDCKGGMAQCSGP